MQLFTVNIYARGNVADKFMAICFELIVWAKPIGLIQMCEMYKDTKHCLNIASLSESMNVLFINGVSSVIQFHR